MARLAERQLLHVVFKGFARMLQVTSDSVFPMVLLKNGLECVLGGTLQKYCACHQKYKSTAPASQILLGAKLVRKRARALLVSVHSRWATANL